MLRSSMLLAVAVGVATARPTMFQQPSALPSDNTTSEGETAPHFLHKPFETEFAPLLQKRRRKALAVEMPVPQKGLCEKGFNRAYLSNGTPICKNAKGGWQCPTGAIRTKAPAYCKELTADEWAAHLANQVNALEIRNGVWCEDGFEPLGMPYNGYSVTICKNPEDDNWLCPHGWEQVGTANGYCQQNKEASLKAAACPNDAFRATALDVGNHEFVVICKSPKTGEWVCPNDYVQTGAPIYCQPDPIFKSQRKALQKAQCKFGFAPSLLPLGNNNFVILCKREDGEWLCPVGYEQTDDNAFCKHKGDKGNTEYKEHYVRIKDAAALGSQLKKTAWCSEDGFHPTTLQAGEYTYVVICQNTETFDWICPSGWNKVGEAKGYCLQDKEASLKAATCATSSFEATLLPVSNDAFVVVCKNAKEEWVCPVGWTQTEAPIYCQHDPVTRKQKVALGAAKCNFGYAAKVLPINNVEFTIICKRADGQWLCPVGWTQASDDTFCNHNGEKGNLSAKEHAKRDKDAALFGKELVKTAWCSEHGFHPTAIQSGEYAYVVICQNPDHQGWTCPTGWIQTAEAKGYCLQDKEASLKGATCATSSFEATLLPVSNDAFVVVCKNAKEEWVCPVGWTQTEAPIYCQHDPVTRKQKVALGAAKCNFGYAAKVLPLKDHVEFTIICKRADGQWLCPIGWKPASDETFCNHDGENGNAVYNEHKLEDGKAFARAARQKNDAWCDDPEHAGIQPAAIQAGDFAYVVVCQSDAMMAAEEWECPRGSVKVSNEGGFCKQDENAAMAEAECPSPTFTASILLVSHTAFVVVCKNSKDEWTCPTGWVQSEAPVFCQRDPVIAKQRTALQNAKCPIGFAAKLLPLDDEDYSIVCKRADGEWSCPSGWQQTENGQPPFCKEILKREL